MREDVVIRPYRASDRAAIRQICNETADRGEPIEGLFGDRELVADLVTKYYTDAESQTSWMAEMEGQVVGYLTGALDTRVYHRALRWRIVPAALPRAPPDDEVLGCWGGFFGGPWRWTFPCAWSF